MFGSCTFRFFPKSSSSSPRPVVVAPSFALGRRGRSARNTLSSVIGPPCDAVITTRDGVQMIQIRSRSC